MLITTGGRETHITAANSSHNNSLKSQQTHHINTSLNFGPNMGQTDPKWDKSVIFFQNRFQYILTHRSEKIPRLTHFGANLAYFGDIFDIPDEI